MKLNKRVKIKSGFDLKEIRSYRDSIFFKNS